MMYWSEITILLVNGVLAVVFAAVTMCAIVFFAKVAAKSRRTIIYVGLSLVLFGCLGYSDVESWLGNPFMSVCNAFQAFFPSRGEYNDAVVKSLFPWRVCAYWIFQYVVMVYSLSIVVAFFGIEFVNTMAVKWRIRNGRRVNIFWDFSNEARWLAEKIISGDKDGTETMSEDDRDSIVFALRESKRSWLRAQDTDTVQILAKEGWKWLYGAPGKAIFLNGASKHFFLGSNGHENVAGANALARSYNGEDAPFMIFGSMEDIYDSALVKSKWWDTAIWVNGMYYKVKDWNEAVDKWRGAKSFDRVSSFASAFHQRNLLRLAGYEIVDKRNGGAAVDESTEQDWKDVVADMKGNYWGSFMRIEHLRWMAFHFVRGVECWRPQQSELEQLASDGDKKRKVKPNMLLKSGERYVHAALRDFDELPQVDALFKAVNQANGQEPDAPLQNKDDDLTYGFNALKDAEFSVCKVV